MKKVLLLSTVLIAVFAVASFAGLAWSGAGYVQYSYSASPANVTITPTTWWMQVTESGTGYSYTANISDGSISSFYFTIPLIENLSVVTGVDGNFGEGTFGGSAYDGPSEQINGSFGGFGFGYGTGNFGLEYTSSAFNAYVQTNITGTTLNPAVYADATFGPATVYGGADGSAFNDYYAGANATFGPMSVYGLFNMAATQTNYLVEAVAKMGNISFGAAYANAPAATYWTNGVLGDTGAAAWVDFGTNVELNASLNGDFSLNTVTLKGYTTVVGNVQGELGVSYSPTSGISSTAYLLTDF